MRRWIGGFLLTMLIGVACGTTATSPAQATPALPPRDLVAVLGCSNTVQHAQGYTDASAADALVFGKGISGITLEGWSDSSRGWQIYEQLEPPGGYTAAWFQLCLFEREHRGSMRSLHQDQLAGIVDNIRARSGNIPIYLSPLNFYESGHVCDLTGPSGVDVAAAIADWGASNLTNVFRGPDTGPLSSSQLVSDGCHLNSVGIAFVGQQLVAFFDR